ncbi:hypothetical protein UK23_42720 [Lentzea aerocolonigenes]|uniref:Tetratricopeptide repeat protein n=1 Tax=Lentzea aerocolonigenes TaxID=68170 RepID=A0A0F0GFP7_LENAE|nr:hypothetical protein [Lentzea aerocolonigenes]KJK35599.1 hypothetical protein UK23_42720 [Lentzea aerocolonigenes]
MLGDHGGAQRDLAAALALHQAREDVERGFLLGHEHARKALHRLRVLGDIDGEAYALRTLGYVHHKLGEHDRAVVVLSPAVDQFAGLGAEAVLTDIPTWRTGG